MAVILAGSPGRAVGRVLMILVVVVVATVLASVVTPGFKTGVVVATAIAAIKALWPLQADVNALLSDTDE